MRKDLDVALAPEDMAGGGQLRPQLAVVVELAVDDRDDVARLVRHRLVARLEVDDRQPAHREADAVRHVPPIAVRAPMA
jgi:hypothetical protein